MRDTTRSTKRALRTVALAVSATLLFSACATSEQAGGGGGGGNAGTGGTAGTGDEYYQAAVEEAKRIAEGLDLADSLEMVGSVSGVEGQTLEEVYAAFTEGTGVEVNYTGTQDWQGIVQSRLQAGNPPDVADIGLGVALNYAKQGDTVDLSAAFGEDLKANFSEAALAASSFEGSVFGIFQGFNNFMLWYNPEVYTGPENPTDWQQIVDWTVKEGEQGNAVWCAAQNAGAESGFPGRQFIENIFLKKYGPDLYRQWGEGTLPWTSPEVKDAFQQFGEIIGNDAHVSGGVAGALSSPIATGYNGLTADPPTCQAVLWGAWVPGLIGETAKPGENIDFFRVPATNEEYYRNELFQGAVVVGFTDNDTTKAFLQYVASAPAQTYLASLNRWPVANKNVDSGVYPSEVLQEISAEYFGDSETQLAVGPNALAGPNTNNAAMKGVVAFLQDPSQLDSILESIQATVE